MKKWIILALSAITFGLSGCGQKGDGGGGGEIGGVPVAGTCQPGFVYTQYGCLQQGICNPGWGQYGQTCEPASVPPGVMPVAGAGQIISGDLQIQNERVFERLLKFGGVCRNSGGFSIGLNGIHFYSSKCRDFTYQGQIQIQLSSPTDGAPAYVQIRSMNSRGQQLQPLNIPMVYQAIAGNQGFTLYDRGQFNFPTPRVRVTSVSGNLGTGQAEVVISFEGREFAYSILGRRY